MPPAPEIVGVIPAAGEGRRLGLPFPKELCPLPYGHRFVPVADVTVGNMLEASVRRLVLVITHQKAAIIRHFGSGAQLGAEISYVCQDAVSETSKSSGLSDAIDAAYHLARGHRVAFGMPDTIVTPSNCFRPLLAAVEEGADLALGLFETSEPQKFGMVETGPDGAIRQVVDKPDRTELTSMWGLAAWSPAFTEFLHRTMADDPSDFATVMNRALAAGLTGRGVDVPGGRYLDLGTPADLARAARFGGEDVGREDARSSASDSSVSA